MKSPTEFYEHDLAAADAFAQKAVNRMRLDDIPPVPQNFEVWYVYYANVNPKLRDEINALLLEQEQIEERDLKDLYEKYLNFGHDRETFERAGDQIMSTLQEISDLMLSVKGATGGFTKSLQNATTRLKAADAPDHLRLLVDTISAETRKMVEYNSELEGRLDNTAVQMGALKRDMERIKREAITDGLTGLANRKAFDTQIGRLVREAKKGEEGFSLIMIDIDHFKIFNDKYGHQVGDQVLRLVALTLIDEVKGQDMAARYGGEEFAIILPHTSEDHAKFAAENLRKAVERKEVINRNTGDNLGQITISLGVAEFQEGEGEDDVIRRADRALYASKHKGRNQVTLASGLDD